MSVNKSEKLIYTSKIKTYKVAINIYQSYSPSYIQVISRIIN